MKTGDPIGNYKLVSLIARGGMGEVWKAHHPRLDRAVAIKFIRAEVQGRPLVREAFEREVQSLARLHSPQTLQIIDFGFTDDNHPYMVTEFLEGEDLLARVRREGAVPFVDALHIGAEVLRSLAEAHALGIVHRDLKPGNVFLQRVATGVGVRSAIKVLDFGVAKLLPTAGSDPEATLWPGVSLKGSPRYMAPEQITNGRVTPATDMYAFGGLLYRMLSGEPPFGGDRDELLNAHLTRKPVPLSIRCPLYEVPAVLDALILRCLSKSPVDRPQSADEVLRALEAMRGSDTAVEVTDELTDSLVETTGVEGSWPNPGCGLGGFGGSSVSLLHSDNSPLPGAEMLAAFDDSQMPSLDATGRLIQPETPVFEPRVEVHQPKPELSELASIKDVPLELDIPQSVGLELAVEPKIRAQARVDAQPAGRQTVRGYGSKRSAVGSVRSAALVGGPVDRTSGYLATAVVLAVLGVVFLARGLILQAVGVDPRPHITKLLAQQGVHVALPGPTELTPMPRGPTHLQLSRGVDEVLYDSGVQSDMGPVPTVDVVAEPGPADFIRIKDKVMVCEQAMSCQLPINLDYEVVKKGYKPAELSGDDLYDRRGGRWKARLFKK